MIIQLKNKDTLVVDEFKLKCCIGRNGLKKNKIEGDKSTPTGTYRFCKFYFRKDRIKPPLTKIKTKIIKLNMGWCNDPKHKFYNKEIKINKKIKHEKLFRRDYKYNYILTIDYNLKKTVPYKGSAIFIHLTKNYNPTEGCIALKKKDFNILLKLIKKNTKIKIS
jgi:L,D-peptidoglycan transpeptidase YkuD (ErfK/YbiS/YcfS/YnhG family)